MLRPGSPWRVEVVERTGSTNTDLAARARGGDCDDHTVLIALDQGTGRGRLARTWTTEPGTSVAMSMAVPRQGRPWGLLPVATGVAVARALGHMGVDARLKWPNDVYIGARKVCGILAEVAGSQVVVGVGINVTQTHEQIRFPTATSLAMSGADVTRELVVASVLNQMDQVLDDLTAEGGGDRLIDAYRPLCFTLGNTVRVYLTEEDVVEGQAVDVAPDGQLLVSVDGRVRAFASGDVYHLR